MTRLTCASVRRRLGQFHDGELEPGPRRSVDAHLAGCRECRDALAANVSLGDALRAISHEAPLPDPAVFRTGVLTRFWAERGASWRASFDQWRHDIGLRWAGLSGVTATAACALSLFGIAWLVPLEPDSGFTRLPRVAQRDIVLRDATWPQRDAPGDLVPAVLSTARHDETDLVLALAAIVTREGELRNPEMLAATRDDREAVLRLMNAVQRTRFTPARDRLGEPVAGYIVWVFAHTTVRPQIGVDPPL